MRRSLILTLLLALSLPVATMAQSGLRTEGDVATASGPTRPKCPSTARPRPIATVPWPVP